MIGAVFPKVGIGNNLPIWYPGHCINGRQAAAFVGMLTSMTFDFTARHKIGGTHLNFFIAQQLPVLPPSAFSENDLEFVRTRVLELTYTSHALKLWAEDLGYSGAPFAWNEDRRGGLRAELDVFFARKYGLTEEELQYVLDPAKAKGPGYPSETFRVLKEREIRQFDEYRTERLVLEAWKQMDADQPSDTLPAPVALPPLVDLSDGAWAWPASIQPRDRLRYAAQYVLSQMDPASDGTRARFIIAGLAEPALLTPLLATSDRSQWIRLVGPEAQPTQGAIRLCRRPEGCETRIGRWRRGRFRRHD